MIKNYIKKYEKYSILTSILMIILSIFLIWKPVKSIELLVIFFAAILVIEGISSFISYFTMEKEDRLFSFDLIIGIMTLLTGIFLFFYRKELMSLFPIFLGIWMIGINLFKMQLSINLSSIGYKGWIWLLLTNILMILLGLLLILKPWGTALAITTIAGIFLLVTEIINLLESISILIKIKD